MIDWKTLNVTVPTTTTPWARGDRPRLAGVSSFGFSGTNAHIILEEAPPAERVAPSSVPERPLHLLPLSARDDGSLRALAKRHYDALPACEDVGAWCHAASVGRAHFAHRVSVRGANVDELRIGLAAFLDGRSHPNVVAGAADTRPKFAFLFTGQGPQHVGMARALYTGLPVFREAFDRCAAIADPLLPRPLAALLYDAGDVAAPIDDARLAQPALFAVEYALAVVWRAWGVEPAAVLGHSFGEYVAACVAGVLSLGDAVRIVIERTRLVHDLAPEGAMAAVYADEATVSAAVTGRADVAIATLNGPDHVVISGSIAGVEHISARFEAAGTRVKRLHVSYGSHSPLMEPVLAPFARSMADVRFAEPSIPLVSNISGSVAERGVVSRAEYWRDHLRKPVRFVDSMRALQRDGITHFIEIGPHPVLLGIGASCVPAGYGAWLPSLRRDEDDWATLLDAVQMAYVGGATIDWAAFDAPWPRTPVTIPTYPFRAKRHWMDSLGITSRASEPASDRWPIVTRAMDRAATQGPIDLDAASYPAAWAALATLTSAHFIRLLRNGGVFTTAGERRTIDDVMTTLGIGEAYRHLMTRRLDALRADGLLRADDGAWVADAPLAEPPMTELWRAAEARLAGNPELLAYVRHSGTLMQDVLTGGESPLETLFPGGSPELAIGLYERSQTMRWVNGLAAAAIGALGASTPAGHELRVLEVGAGTGGTTSTLLSVLPADRTRYRFTDVSDFFFHQARERLAAYPFVEFGRFDVDGELEAQGVAPASYDVVVSANAIHASRDLRAALARLRALLAPGGMLVLVESTTHHDWFDMTTGLIEGWQHFADDLRTDNPLLDAPTWVRALREAGFEDAAAWPGAGSIADALGQHVIIARAPGGAVSVAATRVAASTAPASINDSDAGSSTTAENTSVEAQRSIRDEILDALPDERADLLRDLVRDTVVRVLRLDPEDAPSRRARLMELGMDSLMAVQLRNQLGSALTLDRPLPATLMFDHPTIDALAAFLETRIAAPANGVAASSESTKRSMSNDASSAEPEVASRSAESLAAMSDADVERLLLERLGEL